LNRSDRDKGNLDVRQRLNIVVRPSQERVLEVDHISFHVDGHDLPSALTGDLVAIRKPAEQEARMRRFLAIPDDVRTHSDPFNAVWQLQNGLLVLLVELHPKRELFQHWKKG
jgi:hypothetical protein